MHMGTFSNGQLHPTQNDDEAVLQDMPLASTPKPCSWTTLRPLWASAPIPTSALSAGTITKNSTVKGALSEVEAELNDVRRSLAAPARHAHGYIFKRHNVHPDPECDDEAGARGHRPRLDSEAVLVDNASCRGSRVCHPSWGALRDHPRRQPYREGALQSTEVAVEANDQSWQPAPGSGLFPHGTDLGTFPPRSGNVAIAPIHGQERDPRRGGITDLIFQKTLDLQQLTGIVGHWGGDEEGQPGTASVHDRSGRVWGQHHSHDATVKSALQSVETAIESNDSDIATLKGLIDSSSTGTGVPSHLGSFSGGANGKLTLPANESVKNVLQHIETHADGTSQEVHNMQATVGVTNGAATHLPTFSGTTIRADPTVKEALQDVETAIESNDGELARIRQSIGLSSANDTNMGTFSAGTKAGLTLEQDQTAKAVSQSLLTLVDEESHQVDQLQALTGVVGGSSDLGDFPLQRDGQL